MAGKVRLTALNMSHTQLLFKTCRAHLYRGLLVLTPEYQKPLFFIKRGKEVILTINIVVLTKYPHHTKHLLIRLCDLCPSLTQNRMQETPGFSSNTSIFRRFWTYSWFAEVPAILLVLDKQIQGCLPQSQSILLLACWSLRLVPLLRKKWKSPYMSRAVG